MLNFATCASVALSCVTPRLKEKSDMTHKLLIVKSKRIYRDQVNIINFVFSSSSTFIRNVTIYKTAVAEAKLREMCDLVQKITYSHFMIPLEC